MRRFVNLLLICTALALAWPLAVPAQAAKGDRGAAYQRRPALALPAGMKLQVIVRLRIENDPIGNWLADRLQRTEGYCPGDNGDFRLPWQLYQELLAHLAAPSRTDDDYAQARWEREQFVIELKAIPLCRAGA